MTVEGYTHKVTDYSLLLGVEHVEEMNLMKGGRSDGLVSYTRFEDGKRP